ncbi:FISUMP domain-containing protein [Dysgonomonas sp. 25]|uniref:FISUMP domain-containing protein n=1 Tax=Dysgonomonas sp. 25 TaxID=2302933 RepID=UPI0013D3423E|nr:FISUMP domain-containing protein [Dysgonomonas sp. 25]NDV68055.1 hypothetical protein [Dysgonomonas sp. 25]
MKKTLTRAIILIALTLTTIALHGQVTIGSNQPPVPGALLDLKEDGATNRGLGLPRVKLTSLTIPSGKSLAQTIDGNSTSDNWDKDKHVGLMVYHLSGVTPKACADIVDGMYIWDGNQWQSLQEKRSADVKYMEDNRSQILGTQTYPYRTFGNAGDWMLENLRYIPDNTEAGFTDFAHYTVDYSSPAKYWCYPWKGPSAGSHLYNAAQAEVDWVWRAGIMYTWRAASNGRVVGIGINEGQGEADEAAMPVVQGICPAGWHLPNDREWNELEKEIYNNPTAYSQYTPTDVFTPTTWSSTWEEGGGAYRGSSNTNGHGFAMLSQCALDNHYYPTTGGKSLSSVQGGFDVYLTGYASVNNVGNYGLMGSIWSASYNSGAAWNRNFSNGTASVYNPQQVLRTGDTIAALFSVRCKKD